MRRTPVTHAIRQWLPLVNTLLVAIMGLWIQRTIAIDSTKQQYVALAIEILREEPKSGYVTPLRSWAVEVLAKNSPVALDPNLRQALNDGRATLTSPPNAPQMLSIK